MSVQSMTGFASTRGALSAEKHAFDWEMEARSVNGKGLDLRFRLPPVLNALEPVLRKGAASAFARGNITFSIQLRDEQPSDRYRIDDALMEKLLSLSERLRHERSLQPISVDGLVSTRGVIMEENSTLTDASKQALFDAVSADFGDLVGRLTEARQQEGDALHAVLVRVIGELDALVAQLKDAPSRDPEVIRARLREQVTMLLDNASELDEDRLHQEALLLAVKADIQEEIDRLEAHLNTARTILNEGKPVGKRLDFLAQEFNREANTVCSKANAIEITTIGLAMKVAIDQFREQVQNLE